MEYHIGDQIQRKVLKEQVPVGQIARRIGIERQSLYDIFNSDSVKTSRLMDICKALNYDFFADLSVVFNRSRDEIVNYSDSEEGTDLIRRDEIQVLKDNRILDEAIKRYLLSDSTKPFVIFHAGSKESALDDILKRWYTIDWTIPEENLREIHRDIMFQQWDSELRIDQTVEFTVLAYNGAGYSSAIANCVELMQSPGRHIVLYIEVDNRLYAGVSGGLVYEDITDDLFRRWRDSAHMVVAQSRCSRYLRRKEYYKAYCGDGLFDRMSRQFTIDDNIEKQLFNLFAGYDIICIDELRATDKTGYSRIRISYSAPNAEERRLLFSNGVNDTPRLDMWIDLRHGAIIDFQYRRPIALGQVPQ